MLIDEADALLAGFRSNHHDDTDIVLVCYRLHHLQIIIKRKIRNDGSTDSALYATLEELLDAIVHDRVEITHQYQWKLYFILDSLQLAEELLHGHSVLQGLGSCALNHRTISQRIAERDSYLNHVDALTFHRLNHIAGAFQGWAASTEIQAQKLAVFIVCK